MPFRIGCQPYAIGFGQWFRHSRRGASLNDGPTIATSEKNKANRRQSLPIRLSTLLCWGILAGALLYAVSVRLRLLDIPLCRGIRHTNDAAGRIVHVSDVNERNPAPRAGHLLIGRRGALCDALGQKSPRPLALSGRRLPAFFSCRVPGPVFPSALFCAVAAVCGSPGRDRRPRCR